MAVSDDVTKAVLDTNVWLEWLIFADPSVESLRAEHERGRLRIVACPDARAELADVLGRPRLLEQAAKARRRRGIDAGRILDAVSALGEFDAIASRCLAPGGCGLACTDPDDQRFIDLAVAQRAQWLLTRDRALLRLSRRAHARFGLAIVPPERYLPDPAGARPTKGLPIMGR